MAGVVLLARESGTGRAGAGGARLAAALLLLAEPAMIGDAGFRLSVMATAGLLAWANPLGRRVSAGSAAAACPAGSRRASGSRSRPRRRRSPTSSRRSAGCRWSRRSSTSPSSRSCPRRCSAAVVAMLAGAAAMLGAPPVLATLAGLPGWVVLHVIVAIVRVGGVPSVRGRDAAARARRPPAPSPAVRSCRDRSAWRVLRSAAANTGAPGRGPTPPGAAARPARRRAGARPAHLTRRARRGRRRGARASPSRGRAERRRRPVDADHGPRRRPGRRDPARDADRRRGC